MAQLVARLVRNEKVRGSNPLSSTKVQRTPSSLSGPPADPDGAFSSAKPARSEAVPRKWRYLFVVRIDSCPIHA